MPPNPIPKSLPKIRTRFLLISDTHTIAPLPSHTQTPYPSTPYRTPLPPATILLHAGDITKVGLRTEHETMLAMLKSHPAELKIVIAGNHDITLDEEYYESVGWLRHRYRMGYTEGLSDGMVSGEGGSKRGDGGGTLESPTEIKALYTSAEAINSGIRYMAKEGTTTFTVPSTGARFTVYASPYTPEFCRWAFAYPRGEDRFNPLPMQSQSQSPPQPQSIPELNSEGGKDKGLGTSIIPDYPAVDILLTHGPPYGILDEVAGVGGVGCEHLARAVGRARPALHVFGHIHEGYGGRRVEWDTTSQEGAGTGTEMKTQGKGNGVKKVEEIQYDRESILDNRGVYVDLTAESGSGSGSGRPLRRGEETLFVNASVVNVRYEALNAPWVVDLELDGGV